MGYALHLAQAGERHPDTTLLQGFQGASVLEVRDDYDTDTYRVIYTVRFAEAVYVLHAFKKKSNQGSKMSQRDRELIKTRLGAAMEHHRTLIGEDR